jgi:N-acetylneuraminate synthase
MSTPFDVESAHFLNDLMPVFKISSSDLTNIPFIEIMCDFGKPMILSTGASYLWEIHQAVEAINKKGNQLCLMHCVLNYPTPDANANLGMIKSLIRHFPDHVPGYSDHTLPKDMEVMKMATLLGAAVIEKHFTHDKTLPGNDHYHAMDKEDMKHFNSIMDRSFELLGNFEVTALEDEAPARANARRSLVAAREIPQGKIIERSDLTWKRPAKGVSPKDIDQVIGRAAVKTILEDEIILWNVLES